MTPPPLPPDADKATETAAVAPPPAAEGQRTIPTPFLTKTYQLVEDPAVDDMISWNEDGSTFVVWRPAEFARDLLPKYFKHNNFSSFVRQLNTYGFRKIVPDRWEFANDCFRRGEKRLLCDIHRRKIALSAAAPVPVAVPISQTGSPANSGEEQVLSSNSSPGTQPPTSLSPSAAAGTSGSPELVEENEMLRKENARLSRELAQMKNLCSHIATLISKHGDEGGGGGGGEGNAGGAGALPSTVLELMPGGLMEEEEEEDGIDVDDAEAEDAMEEDEPVKAEEATSAASLAPLPPGESPRLFGVTIGGKRDREEDKVEAPATEVKPEPKEGGSPERHQRSWVVYCPRPIRRMSNGSEAAAAEGEGART